MPVSPSCSIYTRCHKSIIPSFCRFGRPGGYGTVQSMGLLRITKAPRPLSGIWDPNLTNVTTRFARRPEQVPKVGPPDGFGTRVVPSGSHQNFERRISSVALGPRKALSPDA